jgi:glycosyltransferase involved in cell wall biosynthesis
MARDNVMPISVILPNYNHARWLPHALTAIAQQNPSEVVVIDDASTDDSISIITSFQKKYPFIRLIRHGTNLGAEAAVNSALDGVTGDYLLFAASDDFILPGLLSQAQAALQGNPKAAFFCSEVVLIDENDKIVGFRPAMIPRLTAGFVSPAEVRLAIRKSDNWFVGTSVVYRRRALAEIGYFDRSLKTLQDAMATRLLALRSGFFFSPEVLATWRVTPDSLSARSSLSLSENRIVLANAEAWIKDHFPDDIKDEYAVLFDRRMRFNLARAKLVWWRGHNDVEPIADVLESKMVDRKTLNLLSRLPFAPRLIMGWMAIRIWPYGLKQLLAVAWRGLTTNRARRAKLQPLFNRH